MPARGRMRVSIASEMHAGFRAAAKALPDEHVAAGEEARIDAEVAANVARIDAMWTDCRTRFGRGGPFLFGAFGAADAMYAPVVSRFHTYAIEVGALARAYMQAMMALPAWVEWQSAARNEPWVLPEDEPDWPTVLRA